jgi:2-hydroxycyclohexanecarboxyl-CoA dehydrogenase
MDSAFSLTGKRILITGAASGMGRSFAELAAADGAAVGLLDINAKGLDETAGLLKGDAAKAQAAVDLSQWEEVERAVEHIATELGGLDVVCNVAGWDSPGVFWEQPIELWQKLIAINLWGPLHVCRATVPHLLESGPGGRIVNVASDAGRVGSKGETVYAAAKGGVIALTKSLARELAPSGIGVNVICPGPTMTPLFVEEEAENPKLMEKLVRAIPLRRIGEVEDQARAIAFLASEASSYMTGQVVSVSGGLTMVG